MKRMIVTTYIAHHPTLIQVDGRACAGLPTQFEQTRDLVLRLGHNLSPDMRLEFDDTGIHGWFSFNQVQYYLSIPWTSVYAAWMEGSTHEDRITWPSAINRAGNDLAPERMKERAAHTESTPALPGRPKLKLVD